MDDAVGREQLDTAGADAIGRIVGNLAQVVRAPDETLRLAALCLVAEGHLIIEDFPGVGKTMLAKALARSPTGAALSRPTTSRRCSPR